MASDLNLDSLKEGGWMQMYTALFELSLKIF